MSLNMRFILTLFFELPHLTELTNTKPSTNYDLYSYIVLHTSYLLPCSSAGLSYCWFHLLPLSPSIHWGKASSFERQTCHVYLLSCSRPLYRLYFNSFKFSMNSTNNCTLCYIYYSGMFLDLQICWPKFYFIVISFQNGVSLKLWESIWKIVWKRSLLNLRG